jgi:hypothetical protein
VGLSLERSNRWWSGGTETTSEEGRAQQDLIYNGEHGETFDGTLSACQSGRAHDIYTGAMQTDHSLCSRIKNTKVGRDYTMRPQPHGRLGSDLAACGFKRGLAAGKLWTGLGTYRGKNRICWFCKSFRFLVLSFALRLENVVCQLHLRKWLWDEAGRQAMAHWAGWLDVIRGKMFAP